MHSLNGEVSILFLMSQILKGMSVRHMEKIIFMDAGLVIQLLVMVETNF